MNKICYCGKHPERICEAASFGATDVDCSQCNEQGVKSKTFIVVADSYYVRDSMILNPEEVAIPSDAESEEHFNIYNDDNNWQHIRQDLYLGCYEWPENDKDGLKNYVAKMRGLDPAVIGLIAIN